MREVLSSPMSLPALFPVTMGTPQRWAGQTEVGGMITEVGRVITKVGGATTEVGGPGPDITG